VLFGSDWEIRMHDARSKIQDAGIGIKMMGNYYTSLRELFGWIRETGHCNQYGTY